MQEQAPQQSKRLCWGHQAWRHDGQQCWQAVSHLQVAWFAINDGLPLFKEHHLLQLQSTGEVSASNG